MRKHLKLAATSIFKIAHVNRWYYLPVLALLCGNAVLSQDIHLSQFFNTPLLRNPALAGIFEGDIRVQAVYRNQWSSVSYPYQTTAFNLEYKFPVGRGDDFMTLGAGTFYDKAGIQSLKTIQVMPAINFHKSLSGNRSTYLSGGFMAGYVSRQFNGKNLTFDNQYNGHHYDPSIPTGEQFYGINKHFFDIAVGLSLNSEITEKSVCYLGASLWHFNKPVAGFLNDLVSLAPKWQFNAGFKQTLNDALNVTIEGNHLIQGTYQETIAGIMLQYKTGDGADYSGEDASGFSLGGGLMMRLNDAIIPYVQIGYSHFEIGFSYDINTSQLKTSSQGIGGFEFSIAYKAFTHNQNPFLNGTRCPRF